VTTADNSGILWAMSNGETARHRFGRRKLVLIAWLVVAVVIASMFWGRGKIYTNASRTLGPDPVTDVQQVPFEVRDSGVELKYQMDVKLQAGQVRIRLIRPGGGTITEASGGTFTLAGPKDDEQFLAGRYLIEVQSEQAIGTWTVAIHDKNYSPRLSSSALITGKLMVLVGVLAVWSWGRRSHVPWLYFVIGAAIWGVGVVLKFGWALPFNESIFRAINESLPRYVTLAVGALYVGLLTGVFEIGVTVVAARRWPRLSHGSERGIAVGIGAGAAEAIILGMLVSLSSFVKPEAAMAGPLSLALLPVAERFLALLCHASSRALVFFAVATHRWRWAVGGFVLLTGVDTVAGAFLLSKEWAAMSPWLVEIALIPFGLVSIALLVIVAKRWPTSRTQCTQSTDAVRQQP